MTKTFTITKDQLELFNRESASIGKGLERTPSTINRIDSDSYDLIFDGDESDIDVYTERLEVIGIS